MDAKESGRNTGLVIGTTGVELDCGPNGGAGREKPGLRRVKSVWTNWCRQTGGKGYGLDRNEKQERCRCTCQRIAYSKGVVEEETPKPASS